MIQLEEVLEHAPHDSPAARRHSNLFRPGGKRLQSVSRPDAPADFNAIAIDGAFRAVVEHPAFTCVGAKSAVKAGSYRIGVYDELAAPESTAGLSRDLWAYAQELPEIDAKFATFVAVFRQPVGDERAFEASLWRQLQKLHNADAEPEAWPADVSVDPDNPHFAWSFAGTPFFVVGLHPEASRLSRRFPFPALVFNSHEQFEALRQSGVYPTMRDSIRQRETTLQGDINPVLRDFGDDSAARQYSGRAVEEDWKAPFKPQSGGCPFRKMMAAMKKDNKR
jgi:FPC/CPF motif-containing protein YcgG